MTDNIEECSLADLIRKGTLKYIARKLEITPVRLDDENYHDYSLMITALSNGRMKVAKFLMDRGFRVYKKSKPHAEKTPLHYALELGESPLIETMLSKGAALDVATIDDNGKSPLQMAINREEAKVLKWLIYYAEKETLSDTFIFHEAVKNHDIRLIKLLLKKGLSPLKKNMDNETVFCIAIKENHWDVLCLLWDSYQDIIVEGGCPDDNDFVGLLIVAIILKSSESFAEIIEFGFSVNTIIGPCIGGWSLFERFDGFSLLHCAVKYVQEEIVNFLLINEADATVQDATGSTPFHVALEIKEQTPGKNSERYKSNEDIIDALFDSIADIYVNIYNNYGISHFHLVCTRNKTEMVEYFLDHGASVSDSVDLNSPIYKGFSPLHFATKYVCRKTIELLLKVGANIEQEAYFKMTPLHIATRESSLSMVKLLIKYGADITKQDCDGNTPVHYAFEAKDYDILDFLLSVHAIINSNPVNSIGISHFHIACSRNDISIIAGFLRNGASVNACVPIDPNIQYINHNADIDWRGCSPLHFAVAFNRSEVVQFLLEQEANVGISDARGFTPLHMACQYTCERFGEVIKGNLSGEDISEEMDWNHRLYEDNFIDVTALENEFKVCHPYEFFAVYDSNDEEAAIIDWASNQNDHVNIIRMLIDYNCDVNKIDVFGNGPLFYICYFNLKKILNTMNNIINCKTIIQMLLLKSFLEEMCARRQILLNCLLKRDVNMEKCYKNGSILHYISVNREYNDTGRMEIMKIFLNLGANINATDEKMQTPLHLATEMRDVNSVKILLEYGADVNCVKSQNLATPLHIATNSLSQESLQIIRLLLMKEADVNVKQRDGRTPLHNLLFKPRDYFTEFQQIFYRFLSLGVDLNVPDNRGMTPLFMACTIVNCEIVEDLLKFGADVKVKDCNGMNIYDFVHGQIKSVMIAFQKLNKDLFDVFWVLLKHAIKLETIKLLSVEKIIKIWLDLKEVIKPLQASYQDQDLIKLKNKCNEEIVILRNTKIYNNITLYDLLFEEDHEMTKYTNNDALTAVLKSDSFDEAYSCYGYILKLKFNKGLDRIKLLPVAKQRLTCLTTVCLSDICSEYILRHLNNNEIREFIKAVSLIKNEKKTSTVSAPSRIVKDHSKYSRLA